MRSRVLLWVSLPVPDHPRYRRAGPRARDEMDAPLAAVVWDPRFLAYDLGPEHPFSERSRGLAVDLLAARAEAVGARVHWIRPVAPLERAGLERFHEMLDRLEAGKPTIAALNCVAFGGC